MWKLDIGDIVILRVEILGNTPGTRGVVYDLYDDFDILDAKGVSIIFENGMYDGFSVDDQFLFLDKEQTITPVSNKIRDYKFKHVIKVSHDFENGFWDEIFR